MKRAHILAALVPSIFCIAGCASKPTSLEEAHQTSESPLNALHEYLNSLSEADRILALLELSDGLYLSAKHDPDLVLVLRKDGTFTYRQRVGTSANGVLKSFNGIAAIRDRSVGGVRLLTVSISTNGDISGLPPLDDTYIIHSPNCLEITLDPSRATRTGPPNTKPTLEFEIFPGGRLAMLGSMPW